MATSDEPPHAGLAGGLSLGAWGSPKSFDVRLPPTQPFWNNSHPPPSSSSSFLDLNAPFEEDPQPVSRGPSHATDRLVSGPGESVTYLNPAKDVAGDNPHSAADSNSFPKARHLDVDEESMAKEHESAGLGAEPFVDYLSQFSGKKEGDFSERERPKPAALRDVSDFPDELLSLSSSYHKKRGEPGQVGRLPADGAALFLASGGVQDAMNTRPSQNRTVGESKTGPVVMNFGSHRVDGISDLRDAINVSHGVDAHSGSGMEERSLFPRNVVQTGRTDPFYSVSNDSGDVRPFLPAGFARETLDLSNNLAFTHENLRVSSESRGGAEFLKESMSLSLKRPLEGMDPAEGYKKRREEEVIQTSLYSRQMNARDGTDTNSNPMDPSHGRGPDRAGGEDRKMLNSFNQKISNNFNQNSFKIFPADQGAGEDKAIVWPPIVVIENTRLSLDEERSKWKGLGIDDIRKSLKDVENLEYAKVKCLFDMNGQKSSALVIFPPTVEGYFEAEALSDQLERSGKGRDQWMKVRPQDSNSRPLRGFNTPDLVSADGQRILYGYLAHPEDIQRADPHKSGIKWVIESFNEKVRKPVQQRHQEKELHTVTWLKLEEQAKQHLESLESEKRAVRDLMERVMERTKLLEADKRREQVDRQKYEQELESKLKKNDEEKRKRKERFQQREQDIRTKIGEYRRALENERFQKDIEADAVRHGISETIKLHEARLVEEKHLEAVEMVKLEAELRAEMESKVLELKQRHKEEKKNMQDRQQQQMEEIKRASLKEQEDLLRETVVHQEALLREMDDVVRETQFLKQKLHEQDDGNECVVCLEEFCLDADRLRAHYKDCDHANVCFRCAMDLWKAKNRKCPYCGTLAKQKPAKLPAKIYF